MTLYYFDIQVDDTPAVDGVGLNLPNDAAAWKEAARTISELALECIPNDGPQKNIAIQVRDDEGAKVLNLLLTFALQALR
jgi:hypothetical protein